MPYSQCCHIDCQPRQKPSIARTRHYFRPRLFCLLHARSHKVRQVDQRVVPSVYSRRLPWPRIPDSDHHRRRADNRPHVPDNRHNQRDPGSDSRMHHHCRALHEENHHYPEQSRPDLGPKDPRGQTNRLEEGVFEDEVWVKREDDKILHKK